MITLSPTVAIGPAPEINRPKGYEWKAITLMSLGLGLVGIDRFTIVPLMPVLQALGTSIAVIGLLNETAPIRLRARSGAPLVEGARHGY